MQCDRWFAWLAVRGAVIGSTNDVKEHLYCVISYARREEMVVAFPALPNSSGRPDTAIPRDISACDSSSSYGNSEGLLMLVR